jgi:hypothetical protein
LIPTAKLAAFTNMGSATVALPTTTQVERLAMDGKDFGLYLVNILVTSQVQLQPLIDSQAQQPQPDTPEPQSAVVQVEAPPPQIESVVEETQVEKPKTAKRTSPRNTGNLNFLLI